MANLFDYQSLAHKIVDVARNNDADLAHHLWLEGFSMIDDGSVFESASIDSYVENLSKRYLKFTPLVSGSLSSNLAPMMSEGLMRSIHLPVTDEYHLEFWLETRFFKEKLFYMACSGNCRVLAPYVFPLIDLKASVDFSSDPHTQHLIDTGMFFYDPTMIIGYQDTDVIVQAYDAMSKFIKYSRKN